MSDPSAEQTRAANLWEAYARKLPPIAKSCRLAVAPELRLEHIGGLAAAKQEILTYAYATTHPEVYARWAMVPPTGLLLMGPACSGKSLLAEALATTTQRVFLGVDVPRLIVQLIHFPGLVAELLFGWNATLAEMPPIAVFFGELDFSLARSLGGRAAGVPVAAVVDLLLEITDRTIELDTTILVGSTSHPDALPPAFVVPGRFERVVEVIPVFPDDVIAALSLHAERLERQAGRPLFEGVDWSSVVRKEDDLTIGDAVRSLEAVLRNKAGLEAAGERVGPVTTDELRPEIERFVRARSKLAGAHGTYL